MQQEYFIPDNKMTYRNLYKVNLQSPFDPEQKVALPATNDVDPKFYLGWYSNFVPLRGVKMKMQPMLDTLFDEIIQSPSMSKHISSMDDSHKKLCFLRLKRAIYGITLNCLFGIKQQKLGMFFRANNKHWKTTKMFNGHTYKSSYGFLTHKQVLTALEELGYIITLLGCRLTEDRYQQFYHAHWSRFIFTGKLYALQEELFPDLAETNIPWIVDHTSGVKTDMLENLLDEKNSHMPHAARKLIRESRKTIKNYNNMMKKHTVTEEGDYGFIKKEYEILATRKFCRNSVLCGGRVYNEGGVIQTLPKARRKELMIDGKPTVEMDIKGTHLAIIYTLEKQKMMDDPYALPSPSKYFTFKKEVEKTDRKKQMRNFIKKSVLIMINAKDKAESLRAMKYILKEDEKKPLGSRHFIGMTKVRYNALLKAVYDFHKSIKKYFSSDSGVFLMRKDSDIMMHVLDLCSEFDIPVLQVYDSVICNSDIQTQTTVQSFIEIAWRRVLGNTNNLTITK